MKVVVHESLLVISRSLSSVVATSCATFHLSIAQADVSALLFHCPHIVHACQSAMSASVV